VALLDTMEDVFLLSSQERSRVKFNPMTKRNKNKSQVNPETIVVTSSPGGDEEYLSPNKMKSKFSFANMLRDSAYYFATHQKSIAVYHIPGSLLEWNGFSTLLDDIALTWLLGMKIILIADCDHQVLQSLDRLPEKTFHHPPKVTDSHLMKLYEEKAGYVRYEIESKLNRCLKLHGGADLRDPGAMNANVVSGNFYTADPVGVVDNIDYIYSGLPSKVNMKKINTLLDRNDVILLTPCGMSRSGESLCVRSECLAAHVAASLGASKIIYCANDHAVLRDSSTDRNVQNFRLQDAKNILDYNKIYVEDHVLPSVLPHQENDDALEKTLGKKSFDFYRLLGWAALAIENGVERAHIVSPSSGALLTELFTATQGGSTCISQDEVEEIHPDENFYVSSSNSPNSSTFSSRRSGGGAQKGVFY
jgi:amino-acid N-acetyltransferase